MSSDVKQLCSEKSNTFAGAVYLIHYNLRAEKSERKGAHENRAHLGGEYDIQDAISVRGSSPQQYLAAARKSLCHPHSAALKLYLQELRRTKLSDI